MVWGLSAVVNLGSTAVGPEEGLVECTNDCALLLVLGDRSDVFFQGELLEGLVDGRLQALLKLRVGGDLVDFHVGGCSRCHLVPRWPVMAERYSLPTGQLVATLQHHCRERG